MDLLNTLMSLRILCRENTDLFPVRISIRVFESVKQTTPVRPEETTSERTAFSEATYEWILVI